VVSARTLDQLLESRTEIGAELLRLTVEPAKRYGVELSRVGLRDVILPREVQRVMMLEVEADRTGKADLVKARHEVASARARANTAKLLAETPEVARMQELDALLALAGKGGNVVLLPNLADLFTSRRPRDASA
jgi:regulator of protease activity HflC (stomatin/prohibitin superfamily)